MSGAQVEPNFSWFTLMAIFEYVQVLHHCHTCVQFCVCARPPATVAVWAGAEGFGAERVDRLGAATCLRKATASERFSRNYSVCCCRQRRGMHWHGTVLAR